MKKELAYLLGYFYADGYLSNKKHKYPILDIIKSDSMTILDCLNKLNMKYTVSYRFRKNSKNEQACIRISAKNSDIDLFRNILSDKIEMNNIKNYIAEEDYPYFLRGFFDGDGCINLLVRSVRIYFYGSKNQNWLFLLNILDSLDIGYNYTINIRKGGKHQSSFICVSRKYDCVKLFEYLYPNFTYDFGLFRKYEKLLLGKNSIKRASRNIKAIKENTFLIKYYDK